MTTPSSPPFRTRPQTWQRALAEAVRDPRQLLHRLGLAPQQVPEILSEFKSFPLLVPESYLQRMQPGNPDDPLLKQVLPLQAETLDTSGFSVDPVGDLPAQRAPGLLQKYAGRALLLAHSACAVHCRYCFRRHFPYQSTPHTSEDWQPALQALQKDPSIHELLLSGGDPLLLPDPKLNELIMQLDRIPHLRRLRIHSRLPVVLPGRVTQEFIALLRSSRLRVFMVIHANHANELQADCADAVVRLIDNGIPVLNQAVLLRGINDTLPALKALCERCVDLGVLPYYLHQLDRVQGAAHFEVSQQTGRDLIEALRRELPGYAVPRYVVEQPGFPSKTPLNEDVLNRDPARHQPPDRCDPSIHGYGA